MDGPAEIEELSFTLLGGRHRLRLTAIVAALPEHFRTADVVAAAAPLEAVAVSKELKHFRDARLLRKEGYGRWARCHNEFWRGCRELHAALDAEVGPPPAPAQLRDARRRRPT